MYYEKDDNLLEEMEEYKTKKRMTFSSVVNKKKLSKFEMDDLFTGK